MTDYNWFVVGGLAGVTTSTVYLMVLTHFYKHLLCAREHVCDPLAKREE